MKNKFFIAVFLIGLWFIALGASAQTPDDILRSNQRAVGLYNKNISLSECISNGSCGVGHFDILIGNLIRWSVGVSGALALLMYTIGGVWMIFSSGVSSRVERGKDIIKGTTLALFFVLGSWVIVSFALLALGAKPAFQLQTSDNQNQSANPIINTQTYGCCYNYSYLYLYGSLIERPLNCTNNQTAVQCQPSACPAGGNSPTCTYATLYNNQGCAQISQCAGIIQP